MREKREEKKSDYSRMMKKVPSSKKEKTLQEKSFLVVEGCRTNSSDYDHGYQLINFIAVLMEITK